MIIPFASNYRQGSSLAVNSERLVNFYPEIERGGKSAVALHGTPGLTLFGNYGAFAARGMHVLDNALYAVFAGQLLKILTDATSAAKSPNMNTASGFVSMDDNGTQLMFVDGTDGYIFNKDTDVLVEITNADFKSLSPTHCAFLDGYFVVNNENRYYISTINDGLTWDALDFASAEKSPDDITALIADHGELWLFGSESIEIHVNTGNLDFPFKRLNGVTIDWGLAAVQSLSKFDNSLAFLGRNKDTGALRVLRIVGQTPQRISSTALETALDSYSTTADARAYTHAIAGHEFYVISFPTAGKVWSYDAAASAALGEAIWFEKTSNGGRHLGERFVSFNEQNIVSDYTAGNLYVIDPGTYSDNGDEIRGVAVTSHLQNNEDVQAHYSLQAVFQSGVGLITGQGSDPQAMLRWSDDGGNTWSNEYWRSVGKIGKYRTRARWNRLGSARDRVYELSMTDPVKRTIVGMVLNG